MYLFFTSVQYSYKMKIQEKKSPRLNNIKKKGRKKK